MKSRTFVSLAVATALGLSAAALASCSSSSDQSSTDDGGDDAIVADTSTDDVTSDIDASGPCDPVKQDCPNGYKCTIVAQGSDRVTGCVAPGTDPWTEDEGQPCSRSAEGYDDCKIGLACLPDGLTAYSCRKLCGTDVECGAGAKCAATTSKAPYFGNCFATCVAFAGGCGSGTCAQTFYDNDGINTIETCRNIGSGAAGTSCTSAAQCAADLVCYGSSGFKCSLQCDSTHDCGDAGLTCMPQPGLTSGVCQ